MNIITFSIVLGLLLSVDAFSLSLVICEFLTIKKKVFFIIMVGLFHFIMPCMGALFGYKLGFFLVISEDIIFGSLLIFLGLQMLFNILYKDETERELSIYGIILIAFGVALDSFTIGLGLGIKNEFQILYPVVFAAVTMTCTYLGLDFGKYLSKLIGKYFEIIASIILIIFGFIQFF